MTERDVEKIKNREQFIATLRRVADALSRNEAFRIQLDKRRITVPADAELSLEHEVEGDLEELELQLRWSRARTPQEPAAGDAGDDE
jgi:amphi-Trp domain-containing protein